MITLSATLQNQVLWTYKHPYPYLICKIDILSILSILYPVEEILPYTQNLLLKIPS